tara:strand:+ start:77377 stop:77985 length:609 start_codon:yes stop_codon:yes gene_type:complete
MTRVDEGAPSGGRWNLWLGGGTLMLVALCLFVWFPRDISSGFLKKSLTGNTIPGDAFFPVLLVMLMVPLALLLIVGALRPDAKGGEAVGRVSRHNLLFMLYASLATVGSLALMAVGGPMVVWVSNAVGLSNFTGYRAASGTFPYNVSGFFLGGTALSAIFIYITRRKLRTRDLLVSVLSAALLILIFAGLLDNIQLPPNADL